MKIPEGWPTGRMWGAFEDATGAEMSMVTFEKGVKAMLDAAPTLSEGIQMKKDGNAASPNQNIVAIFTAILSALEQQPLGADFEKVLYENLSELYESNTPTQEDEPIYQLQDSVLGFWDDISFDEMQQYEKKGETTRTLYTRPRPDNSAEKIAQMLEAIKEVDVLIRNNLPVDKTTPAWSMIKKILYK